MFLMHSSFVTHMSMIFGYFIYSKDRQKTIKEGSYSVYLAGTKALMQRSQSGIWVLPVCGEDVGGIVSGSSHS